MSKTLVAASAKMAVKAKSAWKGWLFEFVDDFRKTRDPKLLRELPARGLSPRLRALLASTAEFLCDEAELPWPAWCKNVKSLSSPWFPAEVESLKVMALVESPAHFRRRNIFILGNFLARA